MSPVPSPSAIPFAYQLILALIAAGAAISAAVITARYARNPARKHISERRLCLHENGAISTKSVRVMGPESFEENFKTGEVWLPILAREYKYEVYERDTGKRLGRITNRTGSDDEVVVIHIETKCDYWEPA